MTQSPFYFDMVQVTNVLFFKQSLFHLLLLMLEHELFEGSYQYHGNRLLNTLIPFVKVLCVKGEFKHNHDVIYQGRCPEIDCYDYYLEETGRRISERVLDHTGRGQNLHLCRHSIKSGYSAADVNNYKIIEKRYKNNVRKRKTAEALLIK